MAAWRVRAYDLFGFKPGTYSYRSGKVELLTDLADMLRQAAGDGDAVTVTRVVTYVCWTASQQNDHGLQSAADLAFFLPGFRNPELLAVFSKHFPDDLIRAKWSLLMEEPNLLIHKESPAAQE